MKIKLKHIIIVAGAIGFLLMVNLCSVDVTDFEIQKKEINKLHDSKDSLYSVADELIKDISLKEFEYTHDIDSLNRLINNGSLTKDKQDSLKKEVAKTKRRLEQERERLKNLPANIKRRDSIVYNIIRKDSVVYNITYRDTVIVRKRFIKEEHVSPKINKTPLKSSPMKSGGDDNKKKRKKRF